AKVQGGHPLFALFAPFCQGCTRLPGSGLRGPNSGGQFFGLLTIASTLGRSGGCAFAPTQDHDFHPHATAGGNAWPADRVGRSQSARQSDTPPPRPPNTHPPPPRPPNTHPPPFASQPIARSRIARLDA